MTNSKFSFRHAWLDAINQIKNAAIRAEITHAVVHYGLTGERLATKSDVVDAMLSLIIAQIPKKRAPRQTTPEPDVRPEIEPEECNASSDPTDGAHVADAAPTTPPASVYAEPAQSPRRRITYAGHGGQPGGDTVPPRGTAAARRKLMADLASFDGQPGWMAEFY